LWSVLSPIFPRRRFVEQIRQVIRDEINDADISASSLVMEALSRTTTWPSRRLRFRFRDGLGEHPGGRSHLVFIGRRSFLNCMRQSRPDEPHRCGVRRHTATSGAMVINTPALLRVWAGAHKNHGRHLRVVKFLTISEAESRQPPGV